MTVGVSKSFKKRMVVYNFHVLFSVIKINYENQKRAIIEKQINNYRLTATVLILK